MSCLFLSNVVKIGQKCKKIVLRTLLKTHTYNFAGEIRRQKEGGVIGMELMGIVAQIFMVCWDKQLRSKLRELDIQPKLNQVDDTNKKNQDTTESTSPSQKNR